MSQRWQQEPRSRQWQSDGENGWRDRWWDGWHQTKEGLWQQERLGGRGDWKSQGHEWKQGQWEASARGSADTQETGTAVAAGEARGDAAAVAANTESPDEAGTFADWRDDDWQDPGDADAFGLAETTREGDAARAEIAEATWDAEARHEADDDGLTTEESRDAAESVSSLDDIWERCPVLTDAGRRAQKHKVG